MPDARHKWVNVRPHTYICLRCGCCKVNATDQSGMWFVTWHRPDGTTEERTPSPRCQRGDHTEAYIAKYREQIAKSGRV